MWNWLKGFDLRRWWIAAIAVGLVITVTAIAAKNAGCILIGLGTVALGFGEWMNHRMESQTSKAGTLTTFERHNRALGIIVDIVGILLFVLGVFLLIALSVPQMPPQSN